jgi:penicillin-binding protein 2
MFGFRGIGKKNKKIDFCRRDEIEPHEIFYDHLARGREEKNDTDAKKFESPIDERFLRLPLVLAVVFFTAALGRMGYLQAVEGERLAKEANQNKYIFHKVQSERGIIYDSDFNALAENFSAFDLHCSEQNLPAKPAERKKIIGSLASMLGADSAVLEEAIASGKNPIAENIKHQTLVILEARLNDFPGCSIARRPIRKYTQSAGFSHLLGYMGKNDPEEWKAGFEIYSINDYIGRDGLEKSYEAILRKDPGKIRVERDAKGNIISQEMTASPESGDSVRLWLDGRLQKKIYDSMQKQFNALGLKKGAAIALNPKTGGVMALVSFPDYDNNVFSSGDADAVAELLKNEDEPLLNRTISGRYLTGSTIKPFIAAAALQEGIIAADKNINCQGKISVQNQYDPEIVYYYNDNRVHGQTNMYKAIAESCNVYFYTIGGGYGDQEGLGPTRIKKYLDLFGWEDSAGIDLPGEIAGFVPSPEWKKEKFTGTQDQNWTDGNTYWLSIGQEFIGITPLEVANGYAAIANGGTLFKPQMVKEIVDAEKKTIEEKSPEIVRENFIDAKHLAVVREGMRFAVNGAGAPNASALTLNQLGIPMGAKTGTAQLGRKIDGKDLLNAWVAVFAPYDDPQIMLLIMAEEAREGTVAVVPIAKEVLGWYFEPKNEDGVRVSELPPIEEANVGEEPPAILEEIMETPPATIPEEEY